MTYARPHGSVFDLANYTFAVYRRASSSRNSHEKGRFPTTGSTTWIGCRVFVHTFPDGMDSWSAFYLSISKRGHPLCITNAWR